MDPKTKFKLVSEIIEYINSNYSTKYHNGNRSYEYDEIEILLSFVNIRLNDYNIKASLLHANDDDILKLHTYCLQDKNGLINLFHDKYATEVLAQEEKFFNLNLYLNECFECSKADRKIATAMLLRSCVDIFIKIFDKTQHPLAKKIDNFLINILNHQELQMFSKNNKQDELHLFLKGIKDFGNDTVHLNGKNIEDFIEKYDTQEIIKLFCILIEHSILKDSIKKKNDEDIENRVKSIDFTIKEKIIIKPTISQDFPDDIPEDLDDKIPF